MVWTHLFFGAGDGDEMPSRPAATHSHRREQHSPAIRQNPAAAVFHLAQTASASRHFCGSETSRGLQWAVAGGRLPSSRSGPGDGSTGGGGVRTAACLSAYKMTRGPSFVTLTASF